MAGILGYGYFSSFHYLCSGRIVRWVLKRPQIIAQPLAVVIYKRVMKSKIILWYLMNSMLLNYAIASDQQIVSPDTVKVITVNLERINAQRKLTFKNNKLITEEYFRTDSLQKNVVRTYLLKYLQPSTDRKIKLIKKHFKKPDKSCSLSRNDRYNYGDGLTEFDTINITTSHYEYSVKQKNWYRLSYSYKQLVNDKILKEGWVATSGMETMHGDNEDQYHYYQNEQIVQIETNRNFRSDNLLTFNDGDESFFYILNEFSALLPDTSLNKIESIKQLEEYLDKENISFFKRIEKRDSNGRLIQEQFFKEKIGGNSYPEELIIYTYE